MKAGSRCLPRVLLVEDDATSREFLACALRTLPAVVDGAGSAGEALDIATTRRHDLWLFDAHLPDGDGAGLLARLRARWPDTPAVAHTASSDPALHARLLAAGFVEILSKPLPASTLHDVVRRRASQSGIAAVWDDALSLAALNGNVSHVAALRGLFLQELPATRARVLEQARHGTGRALGDELHKLRASCGFVGAARLADAVRVLGEQPRSSEAVAAFDSACEETLAGMEPAEA